MDKLAKTVVKGVRLTPTALERVLLQAQKESRTASNMIAVLIDEALDQRERKLEVQNVS